MPDSRRIQQRRRPVAANANAVPALMRFGHIPPLPGTYEKPSYRCQALLQALHRQVDDDPDPDTKSGQQRRRYSSPQLGISVEFRLVFSG